MNIPTLRDQPLLPLTTLTQWSGAFSHSVPGWQLHWDSTSYSAFCTCPKYYELTYIQGITLRHRSVHLAFGIAWHSAMERFHRLRATGYDYDQALLWTIAETYYRQLRTPEEKLQHQGFHEESVPTGPLSHTPEKTPATLIQAIIQYLAYYKNDDLFTVILPSGKAAVELSFAIELPTGDDDGAATYRGHLDRLVSKHKPLDFSQEKLPEKPWSFWASDYKTTTQALNERYFSQFTPDVQMTGYTLATKTMLPELGKGVVVDGVQMLVTGARFGRSYITRSPTALTEFLTDLQTNIQVARYYAITGAWPMNRKACRREGRDCEFRFYCANPNSRQGILLSDFTRSRIWDPTKER